MDKNADPVAGRPIGLAAFLLLLAVTLALRFDALGDPNLHGDEVFYHTVGVAMHHGALPYVDVWDRKPFGLFALFWLIAAVSENVLAYQIAAALCAAGTAWAIAAIARHWTSARGAVLAGVLYLLYLKPLQGFGGQSPVFYNLFMAVAALLVFRALPALREGRVPRTIPAAMLLAGAGVTLKTTALAEAAFLGLFAGWTLWRAIGPRALRHAVLWVLIGAAPTLVIALAYWLNGHFAEYWHAMVTSNLAKPPHWPTSLARLKIMAALLVPAMVLALLGLLRQERERGFVIAWIAAAVVGLWSMPNFYLHYGMPLAVPLCLAASAFLARGLVGIAAVLVLAALSISALPPKIGHAAKSDAAIDRLVRDIETHRGPGPLFLYDAPPQLYVRTGQPFVTPLVFPTHLSQLTEKDTSHLSTLAETRRVLALRPGAVVMAATPRNSPANLETRALVMAYVGANCRLVEVVDTPEWLKSDRIAVWGDCAAPPR